MALIRFRLALSSAILAVALLACSPNPPEEDTKSETQAAVRVLEYCPAPGQFINLLPLYETGDSEADMCRKAEAAFQTGGMVSLGGFGGYITLALREPIPNRPNAFDFRISGNAFFLQGTDSLGNSEPGIVSVSQDLNGNGLPDDPWYELAGSEYYKPETKHHYTKTWYKSDTTLYVPFHRQPYYPQWRTDTAFIVTGTCLGTLRQDGLQRMLAYGYADNRPNSDTIGISFDIDWAVDDEGNPVKLTHCDFVRVMTGVDEIYPYTGELSTEVGGLEAL